MFLLVLHYRLYWWWYTASAACKQGTTSMQLLTVCAHCLLFHHISLANVFNCQKIELHKCVIPPAFDSLCCRLPTKWVVYSTVKRFVICAVLRTLIAKHVPFVFQYLFLFALNHNWWNFHFCSNGDDFCAAFVHNKARHCPLSLDTRFGALKNPFHF